MRSIIKGLVVFALVYGCAVNNSGTSLLLTQSVVPTAPPQCLVSGNSQTFLSVGTLDVLDYETPPKVVARNYVFNGLLTNQMVSANDSVSAFGNLTNVQTDANNVIIDGYYLTYVVSGDSPPQADPGQDSSALKGSASAFVPANSAAVPASGKGVAGALILPNDIISPMLLGDPTNQDFTIEVHIKADSHTQDGRRLQSNEIVFPIDVCFGCLHPTCAVSTDVYDFSQVCDPGQDAVPACTATTAR